MEEKKMAYWDMCPYCDEEVELYTLGLQQCPNCGVQMVNSVFHKDISWLMDVCVTKWNRRNG